MSARDLALIPFAVLLLAAAFATDYGTTGLILAAAFTALAILIVYVVYVLGPQGVLDELFRLRDRPQKSITARTS